MNTLTTSIAAQKNILGTVTLKVFHKPAVAMPVPVVYYIDAAILCGTSIEVDYTLNDAWLNTSIEFQALKAFVSNTGLNDYCFDSSDHTGEHVQASGSIQLDIYLDIYLNDAVKAYLQSIKAGQYNIN